MTLALRRFLVRHMTAHWKREWPYRLVYWLPKRLALAAFIRVYGVIGDCGPDFDRVTREWVRRYGD